MESSLIELKKRVQEIKNQTEVSSMKKEISIFIESPEFQQLSEDDKDLVMDLLANVNSKQDQFKGCDPITLLSRPSEYDE